MPFGQLIEHSRVDVGAVRRWLGRSHPSNPAPGFAASLRRFSLKGRRIYLSSQQKEPPAAVLEQIRLRWNVENKNHHHRDATFLEDKCRCRTGNTAANLALLRGAVLKIWKTTRPDLPAPAFVQRNQRKLDAIIDLTTKNHRLTNLE